MWFIWYSLLFELIILKALHQCLLRLISKQVTMSALQNLSMEIREFDIARERLAAISLADLHVSPLFQCNVYYI